MLERIKKMDMIILLLLLVLMTVSIFSLYSVTVGREDLDGHHMKMLKYYIVSFVAFFGMLLIDFRIFIKNALYIYLIGIILLIVVNFMGSLNNSQGWIPLPGGLNLQPAELFKPILVLFLTYVLIRKKKEKLAFWKDVVPIGVLTLIPFALVMLQNDLGNALSYLVIMVAMLWIGNLKFSHALIGIAVAAACTIGGIQAYIHYHDDMADMLKTAGRSHWMERIDPWLMDSPSWHLDNAELAIASGGLAGEGYLQGSSVQTDRVPYTYSDSIFVQVAEEFGFVGASVLLLLYFMLIHRMILISLDSRNRGGPYVIVGIVAMFIYQIFENIGAFIGLMPLTGITLPFVSYGGTSLLINMLSMGLVMSIRIYREEPDELLKAVRMKDSKTVESS